MSQNQIAIRKRKIAKVGKKWTTRRASKKKKEQYPWSTYSDFTRLRTVTQGFPEKIRTKIQYVDYWHVASPGTGTSTYDYGLNCCFDPYLGAGGHQPLGFDNFMSVYANYEVINCSMSLTVVKQATQTDLCCYAMTPADATAYAPATIQNATESGSNSKYIYVTGIDNGIYPLPKVFLPSVNIAEFMGITEGDSDLQGSASTNPSYGCVCHVQLGNPNSESIGAVDFIVKLYYDVVFLRPKLSQAQN